MTQAQRDALRDLCIRFNVPFVEAHFKPAFDLPAGWVTGAVGPIVVGVSPEGEVHS